MATFLSNIAAKGLGLEPVGQPVQSLRPRVRAFFEPRSLGSPATGAAMGAATGASGSADMLEVAEDFVEQDEAPSTPGLERPRWIASSEHDARGRFSEAPGRHREQRELWLHPEPAPGQNVQIHPASERSYGETGPVSGAARETVTPKGSSQSTGQHPPVWDEAARAQAREGDHTQPRPHVEPTRSTGPEQAVSHDEHRPPGGPPQPHALSRLQPKPLDFPGSARAEGVRSELRSREEAAPLPTINVTIGRIEVRASVQPSGQVQVSTSRNSVATKPATLSLEEYLQQRGEGRR